MTSLLTRIEALPVEHDGYCWFPSKSGPCHCGLHTKQLALALEVIQPFITAFGYEDVLVARALLAKVKP